jgi:hypothetical protein
MNQSGTNNSGTIFIVSNASCGDVSVQLMQARNEYDVMRQFLLKADPNTYYCGEIGLKSTHYNSLIAALIQARHADKEGINGCKSGYNPFTASGDLSDLEIFLRPDDKKSENISEGTSESTGEGNDESINDTHESASSVAKMKRIHYLIANLSDRDTALLFRYLYTGGYGEQCGNPGKEWTTIEITQPDIGNIQMVPVLPVDPACAHYNNIHYILANARLRKMKAREKILVNLLANTPEYTAYIDGHCDDEDCEYCEDFAYTNSACKNKIPRKERQRRGRKNMVLTDPTIKKIVAAQKSAENKTEDVAELEMIASNYLKGPFRYVTIDCCIDECTVADIAPDLLPLKPFHDGFPTLEPPPLTVDFSKCHICSSHVCPEHWKLIRIPNIRQMQKVCVTCIPRK